MTNELEKYEEIFTLILMPMINDERKIVLECLFNEINYRPSLFDIVNQISRDLFVKSGPNLKLCIIAWIFLA